MVKNAPVMIEFISNLKERTVFLDLNKPKKLSKEGLAISGDLSKEDREDLRVLRYHLEIARSQNHNAKIEGLKLIMNDRPCTVEEFNELKKN
ncbi:hypothetical protein JTB14_020043 [Gonioctena quinquepunctata]|nr:hypothetical protein JTB14_020043 [Gonioctena quinquepunctata]